VSEIKNMKIAYVYLGKSELPRYVLENLTNTKSKFPHLSFVFISDNPQSLKSIKKFGIETWQCSDQETLNSEALNSMEHPMEFRSGFWFNTLARFFALEEFMESSGEQEVLQIEADVWLSPNFPFKKFENFSEKLAYPMESLGRGAASVLYIGSLQALKDFNSFCKLELKSLSSATDMTLLGSYCENHPDRVIVLPSGQNPTFFKDFTPRYILSEGSSHVSYFGGVFDPLSYGMHLFGVDPKNYRGILKLFTDTPHHVLAVRTLEFIVIEEELYVVNNSLMTPIFNLHIHSKNMKIFKNISSISEIKRLIAKRKSVEVNRIVWSVFWSASLKKVKKSWKRIPLLFKKLSNQD
jgi:hypothetical protein